MAKTGDRELLELAARLAGAEAAIITILRQQHPPIGARIDDQAIRNNIPAIVADKDRDEFAEMASRYAAALLASPYEP